MSFRRRTEEEKEERRQNREKTLAETYNFAEGEHDITMFTDYHWKIDGMDVWPSAKKYMKGGLVREFDSLEDIFKD